MCKKARSSLLGPEERMSHDDAHTIGISLGKSNSAAGKKHELERKCSEPAGGEIRQFHGHNKRQQAQIHTNDSWLFKSN